MQRHEMIDAMRALGLKGMASAFDEAVTTGVQRQRTTPEILTDLLRAEAAHRHAASIRSLSERMLWVELDDHLEAESAEGAINRCNGSSRKTMLTRTSKVRLEVPRKYQRRFPKFNDKVVSMYARGITVCENRGHFEEDYGIDVSLDLISTITDAVLETVSECRDAASTPAIHWGSSTPSG